MWSATGNIRGDYYASMPGAYVRDVNPTLWNSVDMQGAWGYHVDTYFHGPTQYLTLYPLAYFDSYAAIAQVLLPIYAVALAAGFWGLQRVARLLAPERRWTIPLLASTFLFFPLLQAFIQREFEVVVFVCLTLALAALLRSRPLVASALLAYIAWFKYVPLIFVGWLALRGWYRAVAVFAIVSVALLAVAHAVFDLSLFVNNNVPSHALQVLSVTHYGFTLRQGHLFGTGFCSGWAEGETTLANVRHGLCSLASTSSWLPPHVIYMALCLAVAAIYLRTHLRLDRAGHASERELRWRCALELSIVTTVYACFLFNHYYYLIVLIIPFNVLLVRYLSRAALHWPMAAWLLAYLLVSAFVIPTSMLSALTGADVWAIYIKGAWFMWGELILIGLLLREYWSLQKGGVHRAECRGPS